MDNPENTTGSEQTTTETAATETGAQTASTDISTTATTETPAAEGAETTLLTPKTGETEAETKAAEQTDEEKAAAEEHAKLFGAPEGDYTLPELPEGQTIDTEALAAVTPIAKELGLSDVGFGKLVDVYAKQIMPGVTDKVVDGLQKDIAAQHATWANESLELIKTDPMFAGKQLPEIQQVAAKALDRFGGTEIREFLGTTGLGNHPAFLKTFYQIGTVISEDTSFERGGGAAEKPKSRTEKYYPNS